MKGAINNGDADLLYGAAAIAGHLGFSPKQVYHLHDAGNLPTFKIGNKVCARRSELNAYFARASVAAPGPKRRHGTDPQQVEAAASAPQSLLYGHRAIAAHLGIPAGDVTRLDAERRLPTYQDDGCTVASTAALNHWNSMKGGR